MVTTTPKLLKKNLGNPDGTKEMPNTKIEWIDLEGTVLTRITLQPGWKWSENVRPTANTKSCQQTHLQYVIGGRLRVEMDNGTRMELVPGDVAMIPPGHDAMVVGNEPFVAIDLVGYPELRGPGVITPYDAHELLRSDPAAVLVCAYEKEDDFQHNHLDGAISLNEFRRRKNAFPMDENVVFYCACPHDETATARANEYFKEGFMNAKILEGGVDCWRMAGYALLGAIV